MSDSLRHRRPLLSVTARLALAAVGLLAARGVALGQRHDTPNVVHEAHRHHRQRVVDAGVAADAGVAPDAGPAVAHTCPDAMVLVEGEYCTNVDERCLRWLDEETQMRCAEFAPTECTGRRRHVAVCMDRYEYPNQPGVNPQVMVNWYEAQRACQSQNKRLCTQSEWTFACEGPDLNPYPYGSRRDETACRIDHQTMTPDRQRLGNPGTSADESARLYEAVPSGSMARCVSWAGVRDMTGNVDEWVVNESGRPFQSALKGGWWGHIRARCRPSTISHNEGFVYYQIGFRCCADPTESPATPTRR